MRRQLLEVLTLVAADAHRLHPHTEERVRVALEQYADHPAITRRVYSHDLQGGEAIVFGHLRAAGVIDIVKERERQEARCRAKAREGIDYLSAGSPLMPDLEKLAVLAEEFGEVAREVCEALGEERPRPNLRTELIQVAAVALAWVEALDSVSPADRRGFVHVNVTEQAA